MNNIVRAWLLALVAVTVWLLSHYAGEPHRTVDASAAASAFSSARAEATLARVLGPEKPHPVSSDENAAVRGRILQEFAALGVHTDTYRAFTCNAFNGMSAVPCATVTDIVADVVPGQGKAIVMMAHYDSVPAGPGASDDESGVATVLETARALKAGGVKSLHPVIALITDGEEGGLLGANAFLQNAALKDRVGAVVNVEARGTRGASLLFQTSPGDGKLIALYAAHVPVYATSSLYAEIYRFLPNDTDLTLFIRAGFPSYNFAFSDNVRYYHSPLDLRRNLDPATLQMHGDNLLGVVGALERTDYAALKSHNAVYLSVLGQFLPRIPVNWAVPLAVIVFIMLLIAAWIARSEEAGGPMRIVAAAAMPLAILLGCALAGWILAFIAQIVSGQPNPTYAYPLVMRIALGFGVWAVTLLVSRMTTARGAAGSAWLWMAGLGIVTAALLPGISPYFVFPAVIAAILLLATARMGWEGVAGQAALFGSALAAMIVWIALVATGEGLMGLQLHELFTVPAAFALMTVVSLLATHPMSQRAWSASIAVSAVVAIVGAVVAGAIPTFSTASPQRVNLIYFENGKADARWIAATAWKADASAPIPGALIKAGGFKTDPNPYGDFAPGSADVAPAGAPRYALPASSVLSDTVVNGARKVTFAVHGSPDTNAMLLHIPKAAGMTALDVRGQHMAVPKGWSGDTTVACISRDCRDLQVAITFANGPATFEFAEQRYGLPAFGDTLKAARPNIAMPSQSGDGVILVNTAKVK
jgi:hypothetical protein